MTNFVTNPGTGGTTFASDTESGPADWPLAKVGWGAAASGTRADYPTPLPVQTAAMYFPVSTGNSTVAQLATGATFTGVIESALAQSSILISLTVDQPGTLQVLQFQDLAGTRSAGIWSFPVIATVDPLNFSLNLIGNYVQVKYTNNGASTTTTLDIGTYYGTILPTGQNGAAAVCGSMSSLFPISLAAAATSVISDIAGQSTAVLTLTSLGTGGAVSIYTSADGVTYNIANLVINDAGGYTSSITAAGVFQFTVAGMSFVKITATALTSGTIVGTLRAGPGDYQVAIDPSSQQTMANSQSVCIASDQSLVPVTDPMVLTSYTLTGVIAINTVLVTLDCSNDAGVSVQCSAMGTTGVVTPEWSNDNATWIAATSLVTQAGVPITTITAAGLWTTRVHARYLRLRMSTATTAATTTFSAQSSGMLLGAPQALAVVQPTASAFQASATQVVGTAATRWFAQVSDGTNSPAIKAASTAAAATDASMVVALSPNSPQPATTSALQALTNINVNATGALVAVKASAGNLFGLSMFNGTAAIVYLSFWNVATGSVTLGTTAPTCVFALPASGTLTVPPSDFALLNSATAISFAAVTTYNGATTASVTGSIFFK